MYTANFTSDSILTVNKGQESRQLEGKQARVFYKAYQAASHESTGVRDWRSYSKQQVLSLAFTRAKVNPIISR